MTTVVLGAQFGDEGITEGPIELAGDADVLRRKRKVGQSTV